MTGSQAVGEELAQEAFLGLLREETPPGWARAQLPRPLTGVILYAAGGLAGWFISPWLGILSIVAMIIYHAFTSEGVRRRGPARRDRPEA